MADPPPSSRICTGDGAPWSVLSMSIRDGVPTRLELQRDGWTVELTTHRLTGPPGSDPPSGASSGPEPGPSVVDQVAELGEVDQVESSDE